MVQGRAPRRWMNRSYRPQTVDHVATAPRRWISEGIVPGRIIAPTRASRLVVFAKFGASTCLQFLLGFSRSASRERSSAVPSHPLSKNLFAPTYFSLHLLPDRPRTGSLACGYGLNDRLLEIGDQVVGVFQTDRQSDQRIRNTRCGAG